MAQGINVVILWKKLDVNCYCYSHGQAMDTLYSWPSSKGLVYVIVRPVCRVPYQLPACVLSVCLPLFDLSACLSSGLACLSVWLPASLLVCLLCLLGCFSICLPSCMSLKFSCLSESHTVFLCVCLSVYVSTRFVVRITKPESFAVSLYFV
jgi:hypothetical protein